MVLVVDIGGGAKDEALAYYRSVGGGDHLYAMDQAFRVATQYEVFSLGTTVIVDRTGVITFRDAGPTPADLLAQEIRRALA